MQKKFTFLFHELDGTEQNFASPHLKYVLFGFLDGVKTDIILDDKGIDHLILMLPDQHPNEQNECRISFPSDHLWKRISFVIPAIFVRHFIGCLKDIQLLVDFARRLWLSPFMRALFLKAFYTYLSTRIEISDHAKYVARATELFRFDLNRFFREESHVCRYGQPVPPTFAHAVPLWFGGVSILV